MGHGPNGESKDKGRPQVQRIARLAVAGWRTVPWFSSSSRPLPFFAALQMEQSKGENDQSRILSGHGRSPCCFLV
jgi:hypothetical protein